MSFSDQPSPYAGGALAVVIAVALVRVGIPFVPAGVVVPLLVPAGAIALVFALLAALRRWISLPVRAAACVPLGQGLAMAFGVYMARDAVPPGASTVVLAAVLAAALLLRPGAIPLGALMAAHLLGACLAIAWLARMPAGGIALVPGIGRCLLHGAGLGLAWYAFGEMRKQRMARAFDEAVYSQETFS